MLQEFQAVAQTTTRLTPEWQKIKAAILELAMSRGLGDALSLLTDDLDEGRLLDIFLVCAFS
jgi:hypothetical protein